VETGSGASTNHADFRLLNRAPFDTARGAR